MDKYLLADPNAYTSVALNTGILEFPSHEGHIILATITHSSLKRIKLLNPSKGLLQY